MGITLQTVRTWQEIAGLEQEWNHLLASSASNVPFLRQEYLRAWWQTLGGGEWPAGDLYLIIGRHEDGSLAGIAPLFFTENLDGEAALMLVGSIEISDFLDVIAPPAHLEAFLTHVVEYLAGPAAPGWQALDWYNVPAESPTLPALKALADREGWRYHQAHYKPAPFIPLPGDWQAYLAGIDKKQRHEIRRKVRRVDAQALPSRWYIVQDGAGLDAEMESFLDLMAQDPRKGTFLTDKMRACLHAIARRAFEAGWLQLAFLEVGGEKAAGYLNFDYANRIWSYNSGWDSRFRELSPGWVLLAELLKWANESRREAHDFLRGAEAYKYRFGAVDRFVERVTVRRA